jgi:hypothetical protein
MRAPETLSTGLQRAPDWDSFGNSKFGGTKSPGLGQFPSSQFFSQNNICMSPVVGSQYGARYDRSCGEKSNSSALPTGQAHYAETQKSKNLLD